MHQTRSSLWLNLARYNWQLLLPVTLLFLSGCITLGNAEREIQIERQWVKELPYDDKLGAERFHGMTPVADEGVIFQGNGKDAIVAVSRKTGRELWNRRIENGVSSGAVIAGQALLFGGSDGQFYSLNKETGELNWTFPVRAEVLSEPLLSGETLYFLTANNIVYALDAKTGKQKWLYNRTDTTTFSIRGGARPLVVGNSLYIGLSDGFFVALNASTGALQWERNLNRGVKFKDVNATAVLDGQSLYVSSYDDSLYRLSLADGQIQWRVEKGGHAPVTLAGDLLFFPTSEGELLGLKKSSGETVWSRKLPEGVATQPVLMNELLVYGESRGDLVFLNSSDGKEVRRFASGRGLVTAPLVEPSTGEIFFVSNAGNLYALRLSWQNKATRLPWEKN